MPPYLATLWTDRLPLSTAPTTRLAKASPLATPFNAVDKAEKPTAPAEPPAECHTCCRWRYSPPTLKVCAPCTQVISSLVMCEGRVVLLSTPAPELLPQFENVLTPLP